jgi:hypothetical protein
MTKDCPGMLAGMTGAELDAVGGVEEAGWAGVPPA